MHIYIYYKYTTIKHKSPCYIYLFVEYYQNQHSRYYLQKVDMLKYFEIFDLKQQYHQIIFFQKSYKLQK